MTTRRSSRVRTVVSSYKEDDDEDDEDDCSKPNTCTNTNIVTTDSSTIVKIHESTVLPQPNIYINEIDGAQNIMNDNHVTVFAPFTPEIDNCVIKSKTETKTPEGESLVDKHASVYTPNSPEPKVCTNVIDSSANMKTAELEMCSKSSTCTTEKNEPPPYRDSYADCSKPNTCTNTNIVTTDSSTTCESTQPNICINEKDGTQCKMKDNNVATCAPTTTPENIDCISTNNSACTDANNTTSVEIATIETTHESSGYKIRETAFDTGVYEILSANHRDSYATCSNSTTHTNANDITSDPSSGMKTPEATSDRSSCLKTPEATTLSDCPRTCTDSDNPIVKSSEPVKNTPQKLHIFDVANSAMENSTNNGNDSILFDDSDSSFNSSEDTDVEICTSPNRKRWRQDGDDDHQQPGPSPRSNNRNVELSDEKKSIDVMRKKLEADKKIFEEEKKAFMNDRHKEPECETSPTVDARNNEFMLAEKKSIDMLRKQLEKDIKAFADEKNTFINCKNQMELDHANSTGKVLSDSISTLEIANTKIQTLEIQKNTTDTALKRAI